VVKQREKALAITIGGKNNKNQSMLAEHIKEIVREIQLGATPLPEETKNVKEGQENG